MIRQLLTFGLCAWLTACATQPPPGPLGDPENPYPPNRPPEVGDILHIPTGIYVDADTLYDHARRARIIYVGETHDNPASHRIQLAVLRALVATNPDRVSVGMEMFTPQQQSVLDQWSAGVLMEKEFLKAVNWADSWGMNFAYYRDFLTFCKQHRIKILGLNTNRDTRMAVARNPTDALAPEVQAQLPEMDDSDPYHHAMLDAVFADHKMGQGHLDGFKRVQTLWDETMAENAARYLERVSEDHQLLIIAGSKHVSYGFGIPRRLFRRVPDSYLLIGGRELVISEEHAGKLMNIVKPSYPMPPYHFMVFTEYESLENPGVTLGVALENAPNGLRIVKVLPDSVAESAGLQTDDVLTHLNDSRLTEVFDLTYALSLLREGDAVTLTRERKDVPETLAVTFVTDDGTTTDDGAAPESEAAPSPE